MKDNNEGKPGIILDYASDGSIFAVIPPVKS